MPAKEKKRPPVSMLSVPPTEEGEEEPAYSVYAPFGRASMPSPCLAHRPPSRSRIP